MFTNHHDGRTPAQLPPTRASSSGLILPNLVIQRYGAITARQAIFLQTDGAHRRCGRVFGSGATAAWVIS